MTIFFLCCAFNAFAQAPVFEAELILPFQEEHVHGSTIVELPNGGLLAAWYQGSGERWADDVKILGARKDVGSEEWSQPFVMADVEGFPDINPILFIDGKNRLWLMWYTVIANQWRTSLLKYRYSNNYMEMSGSPKWDWQSNLFVRFDTTEWGIQPDDSFVESVNRQVKAYKEYLISSNLGEVIMVDQNVMSLWHEKAEELLSEAAGNDMIRDGYILKRDSLPVDLGYPYYRRMGWQTRNKPFITQSGRMIVPLYSDGFSISLMAYTDDWGKTWEFSEPLVGFGNIQPAIAETESGVLVAYMRDSGPKPYRLQESRSFDDGETWSTVKDSQLPNPGSAIDIVTLDNGDWVLIYNDTEEDRHSLAVALSEDGGKTWPWKRKIEYNKKDIESIYAAYPAITEGENGMLHATYSFRRPKSDLDANETIKYVKFNVAWIKAK